MTPKSLQSRLKIAKNAKFGSTETAKIMQKTEGAIKALQHRSLDSLRRYLQQQIADEV